MQVLNFEPAITIALEGSCRRQGRLVVETRTNAYQVRRGDFPEESISVYFTVRQYGSLQTESSYEETLHELRENSEELLQEHVIERVIKPLHQAISIR